MVKDFKYCENPDAEVPRMFIDKEIGGKDADGLPNIDGNSFLKELMYLSDVLGKSKGEVWINSPGGIVTDGQSIYASILESKATVDTVCYGIAASISGVIFQAGRKRIMMDYAHLMYHPAYSSDGKVDKGLLALNNAICTMVAKRTGKTEDEIWAIMNRGRMDDKGTWISAEEALEMGFCDEIRHSDAKNSIEEGSINSIWKSANIIYNRVIEQPKKYKMKQVLNKLGLVEDANETSALAAIEALNKKAETMEDAFNKKCDELKAKQKEVDDMKNAMEEDKKAKAKAMEEEDKAKAKTEEEDKAKNADLTITKAVADGKIKNEATVIAGYKALFIANPVETGKVIEALPINKSAAVFTPTSGTEIQDSEAESIARTSGLKPGSAAWYNSIKIYELQKADSASKIK